MTRIDDVTQEDAIRHLTDEEVAAMRSASIFGLDDSDSSWALLHVLVCPDCATRFGEMLIREGAHRQRRMRSTGSEPASPYFAAFAITERLVEGERLRLPIIAAGLGSIVPARKTLDAVERSLRDFEFPHLRPTRLSAIDVVAGARSDGDGVLLIDAAALLPRWDDMRRWHSGPIVAAITGDDWDALLNGTGGGSLIGPDIVGEVMFVGPDNQTDTPADIVDVENQSNVLNLLALLGCSLPVETVARLADMNELAGNQSGWIADANGWHPGAWDRQVVEARTVGRALRLILQRADTTDAPVVLAVLRKLALDSRLRSEAARIVQGLKTRVNVLRDSPNTSQLDWIRVIANLGLPDLAVSTNNQQLEPAAQDNRSERSDWAIQRARLLAQEERYTEAADILQTAADADRRNAAVWLTLASVRRRAGMKDEAERPLARAEALARGTPHILLEAALIRAMPHVSLPSEEDYEEADGLMAAALSYVPGNGVVLNAWARLLRRRADYDQARSILNAAIAQEPANIHHRVELATLLNAAGEPDAALTSAWKALSIDPANLHALVTCATILIDLNTLLVSRGDRSRTASLLGEAALLIARARERGDTPVTLVAHGVLAAARGDWESAERSFESALRRQSRGGHAVTAWASSYRRRGQPRPALELLGAYPLPPSADEDARAAYAVVRASCHADLGELDVAAGLISQARKTLPEFPRLLAAAIAIERQRAGADSAEVIRLCGNARKQFPNNEFLQQECSPSVRATTGG